MFIGAIVLVLIILLFLRPDLLRSSERSDVRRVSTAEEILKERYARGELSTEEYKSKLNDLRGGA
jgi:putative membrane protein